jgi:hypothetical protein
MSVQKIQSVYIVVNDMDALQAFYSRVLGTQAKFRDQNRWTQFSVGNTHFALSSAEEAMPGATGSVIVFEAAGPRRDPRIGRRRRRQVRRRARHGLARQGAVLHRPGRTSFPGLHQIHTHPAACRQLKGPP